MPVGAFYIKIEKPQETLMLQMELMLRIPLSGFNRFLKTF
jgi:hypothetical protein